MCIGGRCALLTLIEPVNGARTGIAWLALVQLLTRWSKFVCAETFPARGMMVTAFRWSLAAAGTCSQMRGLTIFARSDVVVPREADAKKIPLLKPDPTAWLRLFLAVIDGVVFTGRMGVAAASCVAGMLLFEFDTGPEATVRTTLVAVYEITKCSLELMAIVVFVNVPETLLAVKIVNEREQHKE